MTWKRGGRSHWRARSSRTCDVGFVADLGLSRADSTTGDTKTGLPSECTSAQCKLARSSVLGYVGGTAADLPSLALTDYNR
jgi:hypothetical protein